MAQIAETIDQANHSGDGSADGVENRTFGLEVEGSPPEDAVFDIVAVHGLHGERRRTWQREEPSDNIWLPIVFQNVTRGKPVRMMMYGYDSGEASETAYTRRGIYREAQTLLHGLLQLRTPDTEAQKRPIAFVSYDVGGLIVKAAMNLSLRDPSRYGTLLPSIRVLIFFGYPHRRKSAQNLEEQVFRLLSLQQRSYQPGRIIKLAKSLSEFIHEVNEAFIHTKLLIQINIVNIFSADSRPEEQVFNKFSATLGVPGEYRIESKEAHMSLTKPDTDGSNGVSMACGDSWGFGTFEDKAAESLRMLTFQASPIYPPRESRKIGHCSELDDFVIANSNCVLHVQCDSDTAAISQGIVDFLITPSPKQRQVLYFPFNSRDIRFNSISAMLATFIPRLAYASLGFWTVNNTACLNRLLAHRAWNAGDLNICWEALKESMRHFDIFYVLGEFDQCDGSSRWFLKQIQSSMKSTESRLKIVFTSTTQANQHILPAMTQFPVDASRAIRVESQVFLEPIAPAATDFEVTMLLQERPQYLAFEPGIRLLLRACALDFDLARAAVRWLRSREKIIDAIPAGLDYMSPFTPATVCATMLRSVPGKRQGWAGILLSWVLLAVRPLRVQEFCAVSKLALGLQEKPGNQLGSGLRQVQSEVDRIHARLPGIFTVVHDEIHFSHSCLHHLLEPGSHQSEPVSEWYRGKHTSRRHLDILEICLAFLTLPTTPKSTEDLPDSDPSRMSESALLENLEPDELPYAVQHWARHYKKYKADRDGSVDVIENGIIENGIFKLLRDHGIRQSWQQRYQAVVNPFLQPSEPFQTPLSVAAYFGLDDLVQLFYNEFSHEGPLALVEAGRNGYLPTVQHILQPDRLNLTLDHPYLGQALMAAMATGKKHIIWLILQRVGHHKPYARPHAQPQAKYPWLGGVLCRAAYLGLEEVVQRILGLGADIDSVDELIDGRTPLGFAAIRHHHRTAKILLDAGASPIVRTINFALTPLHTAAVWGSADIVRLLLQHGAEPEAKNVGGFTPLQFACSAGHHAAVEVLLDHKRFQDYHDPEESHVYQPLLIAVKEGRMKTVDSFLRHHADPNVRDQDGTSLFHAVGQRRIDICHLLLANKVDVDYVMEGSRPALIEAVRAGDIHIVNLLLAHHADTEKTEEAGGGATDKGWRRTALHVAVCNGEREMVKVLLERGANPNVRDADGWTTLWAAARFGYAEIAKLLIGCKADIHSVCTTREWTPLHAACDSPEVVAILLQHGADVNKSSPSGTPLAVAALHNQHEAVKLMLSSKNGKNPPVDLTTEASRAVLIDAAKAGHREIVRHMLEAGADVNFTDEDNCALISMAVARSDEDMLRTILEFRPDMEIQDSDGDTCLHYIRHTTSLASVRLAVNAGAKINTLNEAGEIPLHQAAAFSDLEVVEYLLAKNADVNCQGGVFGAPLHCACYQGKFDVVKLLIDNGANPNFPSTGMYGTPMIAACVGSKKSSDDDTVKILRLLVETGADIGRPAGLLGYAILAASLASSAVIAKFLLNEGASPDVEDQMGRISVHHASYNSIATLTAIGDDLIQERFAVKDKGGRVALHCAAVTGQLDLVKHVLERSETVGVGIDEPDNDGWTPLLWAARAAPLWACADRSCYHFDVVNFLLENGANPEARGKGIDREWLPQEVAFYHGAAPTVVAIDIRLASPRKFHGQYKKGLITNGYCDFCLMVIYGIWFSCLSCNAFYLCFKCGRSKEILHPEHDFIQRGDEEYEEWSDKDTEPIVGETSRTEAQDNELEASDFLDGELDDADDNLLDLVEREIDGRSQGEDDATGEGGMKTDSGSK